MQASHQNIQLRALFIQNFQTLHGQLMKLGKDIKVVTEYINHVFYMCFQNNWNKLLTER